MIDRFIDRSAAFMLRFMRAWRFWRRLDYSWRLSWAKAGSQCGRLR